MLLYSKDMWHVIVPNKNRKKKHQRFHHQIMQTAATYRSFIERNAYNLAFFFVISLALQPLFNISLWLEENALPTVYLFIHKY